MASPLLKKSGMEREVNAVESEFQMTVVDDNARSIQILMNECSSKDHLFNLFCWGNLKSLVGDGDYDKLWDDLKKFYNEQYSADRMRLAVQVKTKDGLAEVRSWVEEYFGAIGNKGLGLQDFSKMSRAGPNSPLCGALPFAGCENELICSESHTDRN